MFGFLIKRLGQALTVMFVISLVAFAIQDNLGDPLRELVGQSVSESERQQLRDDLGLNDPFITKYSRFLGNALQGDLGTSYTFKRPATEVILDKLVATLELVFGATLIIVLVSIPLGVYSAIHHRRWITKAIMAFSSVGISIPVFLTAIMLMYVFSIELGWLPSFGRGETANYFGWESGFFTLDGLKHLVLPCVALASIMLPLFIRLVRSEMLEVLSSEYIKFAKAKGLPMNKVYYPRFKKHLIARVDRWWRSDRNDDRLHLFNGKCFSMAGHWIVVFGRNKSSGYALDHRLRDFCGIAVCGDEHHCGSSVRVG